MDLVGLLQTELSQSTAELQGQLLVFDKALVAVATHLKVGPLLVDLLLDTINDLLDLLVLDMGLDQVTSSDGLRIAVNTRGAAEDIVGSSDILSRAKDEAILGGGQSTRNGLALNRLVSRSLYGERRLLVHARLDAKLLELLLGHRHLGGTGNLDGGNGKTGSVGDLVCPTKNGVWWSVDVGEFRFGLNEYGNGKSNSTERREPEEEGRSAELKRLTGVQNHTDGLQTGG